MIEPERAQIAGSLLEAYASRIPVEPLTSTYPGLSVADAYAIQVLQVRHWQAAGAQIAGHKVGLTSAAMQRQFGVDQPDYGHLTDGMFWLEHERIPASRFLQPRAEPEIAFVLARPLKGPGVRSRRRSARSAYVLPALELIDSRIRDWKIGLADTIADNASSAGVVLGGPPTALTGADLRLAGCTLHRNGVLAGTGAGGAVLGLAADLAGLAGQHDRRARGGAGGGPGGAAGVGDGGHRGGGRGHGDGHVRGAGPGDRAVRD